MSFNKSEALRKAEKFLAAGKIRQAVNEYQEIVKRDPDDIANLNILGDLLIKADQTQDALKCFCRVAEHYNRKGFPQKAIAVYNKIFRYKPDCTETLEKIAELNRAKGAVAEARSQYKKLAEVYEKKGEIDNLIRAWKAVADLDKQNAQICIRLGELCRQHGRPTEAADAFAEAGDRFFSNNSLDLALEAYSNSLEEEPEHVKGFQGYVRIALVRGTYLDAIDKLENILNDQPENPDLRELLAECYLEMGEVVKAEEILMGLFLQEASRYKHLLRVLKSHITNGEVKSAMRILSMIADNLLSGENPDRLLDWTDEILARDPSNLEALRLQARYHTSKGDVNAATSILDQISVMASKSVNASAPLFAAPPDMHISDTDIHKADDEPKGLEMFDGSVMPDYTYENQSDEMDSVIFGEKGIDTFSNPGFVPESAREFLEEESAREFVDPCEGESIHDIQAAADDPDFDSYESGKEEESLETTGAFAGSETEQSVFIDEQVVGTDLTGSPNRPEPSSSECQDGSTSQVFNEAEPQSQAYDVGAEASEAAVRQDFGFEILAISHETMGRGLARGKREAAESALEDADGLISGHADEGHPMEGHSAPLEAAPQIQGDAEFSTPDLADGEFDGSEAVVQEATSNLEHVSEAESFEDFEPGFTCDSLESTDACATAELVDGAAADVASTFSETEIAQAEEGDSVEAEFGFGTIYGYQPSPAFGDESASRTVDGVAETGAASSDESLLRDEFEPTSFSAECEIEVPEAPVEMEFTSFADADVETALGPIGDEFEFAGEAVEIPAVVPHPDVFEPTSFYDDYHAEPVVPVSGLEFNGYAPEETDGVIAPLDDADFDRAEHFGYTFEDSSADGSVDAAEAQDSPEVGQAVNPFAPRLEFDFDGFEEGGFKSEDALSEGLCADGEMAPSLSPRIESFEPVADAPLGLSEAEDVEEDPQSFPDFSAVTLFGSANPTSNGNGISGHGEIYAEPESTAVEGGPVQLAEDSTDECREAASSRRMTDEVSADEWGGAWIPPIGSLRTADEGEEPLAFSGEAVEFEIELRDVTDEVAEAFPASATAIREVDSQETPVEVTLTGESEAASSITTDSFESRIDKLVAEMNLNFTDSDLLDSHVETFERTEETIPITETAELDAEPMVEDEPAELVEEVRLFERMDHSGAEYLTPSLTLADVEPEPPSDFPQTFFHAESIELPMIEEVAYPKRDAAVGYPETFDVPNEPIRAEMTELEDVSDIQARENRLNSLLDSVDFFINEGFFEVAQKNFDAVIAEFGHRPQFAELEERLALFTSRFTEEEPAHSNVNTGVSLLSVSPEPYDPDFPELSTLGMYTPEEIKNMVQVVEIDEDVIFDFETFFDTATAYREMGLLDYAIREFENALKLVAPDDGTRRFLHCCSMLGHCFMDYGKPDLAVIWFRRAQETTNLTPEEDLCLLYEVSQALEAHGKTAEAARLRGHIHANSGRLKMPDGLLARMGS